MTQSETYFERFCTRRRIPCRRIPESVVKTPDYEITIGALTVSVEVKQIEPNAQDLEVIDRLSRGAVASQWVDMSRARQSILDGVKQLRAHVKNDPALVVLYEKTGVFGFLDSASIAQCLYGPLRVHVGVPVDPTEEPWMIGNSRGGGRIATEQHNTTLSAVAVLRGSERDDSLSVFHNAFAVRPIAPHEFRFHGVRHFAWRPTGPELLPEWIDVTEMAT